MDVLKENARYVSAQLHVCEVPKALDAQVDEAAGHGLRHMLGHREDSHVGAVLRYILLQLVHRANGDIVNGGADEVGEISKAVSTWKPTFSKSKFCKSAWPR